MNRLQDDISTLRTDNKRLTDQVDSLAGNLANLRKETGAQLVPLAGCQLCVLFKKSQRPSGRTRKVTGSAKIPIPQEVGLRNGP